MYTKQLQTMGFDQNESSTVNLLFFRIYWFFGQGHGHVI